MADIIRLGSGTVYVDEYDDGDSIPADATIETTAKRLGFISGGATLEYKPTYYTCRDDSGKKSKTIITDEEAHFKTGLITFITTTLSKLAATARETTTATLRTLKIGGIGQNNGKKYVIRFVHEDSVEGDLRVTIVGVNTAGFTLTFKKDKETVVDADFLAFPHDDDGTLIQIDEEIPAST